MNTASSDIVEILKTVLGPPEQPVALHEPCLNGQEWTYIKECLDAGWVSSVGSYVDLFEQKLAEKCGVDYAFSTMNGTSALHIALLMTGIKRNDEVLMPALTFVATANAVSYCGATPHFVECEKTSLGIDAEKLSEYLETIGEQKNGALYNKETGNPIAAILPVHIFGHPADMEALQIVADKYKLPIISDAAEALGSFYKDKPVSSYGLLSVTSFNGNKIVTTGGGGALLTNDPELAARARHIATTAKIKHPWAFIHDHVGYNYRMPNINAAMGCAQLEKLDDFLLAKRKLARAYEAAFQNSSDFEFMTEPDNSRSNYWLNAVFIKSDIDRDQLLETLHNNSFLCRPVWTLMHKLEMYKNCPRMDLDTSENLASRIINLPSSVKLGRSLP